MQRKKINAKIVSIRQPISNMNFEERVRKLDQYINDPELYHKIFTELGFSYVEDGCTGGCEVCERKEECETYREINKQKPF